MMMKAELYSLLRLLFKHVGGSADKSVGSESLATF